MASEDPVTMDEAEVDAFVGRGGTGVLALAVDDEPYATPVSFGYDPSHRAFFLRLGFGESSEKDRFIDGVTSARMVVYDRSDDIWTSVIATGELSPVDADELSVDVARALQGGDVPLLDIWGESTSQLAFELYRLDVDRLTGRRV